MVGIGPTQIIMQVAFRGDNVRRAIVPLLAVLGCCVAPLSAQTAFTVGYSGTLGNSWQIEALELGFVKHTGLGPVRYVSATARIGWFGDQAAIIGGTRGFIAAGAFAVRSGRLSIFEVGQDASPTVVGLDLTLEAAGYLASRAPNPPWHAQSVSLAALPGLRIGQAGGTQFVVLAGPAWFSGGGVWRGHAFVSARAEIPLAHGGGGP